MEPRICHIKTLPSCPDYEINQFNTSPSFADLQYMNLNLFVRMRCIIQKHKIMMVGDMKRMDVSTLGMMCY